MSHRRSGRVGDASSMAAVNVSAQPIFGMKIGRTCGIGFSQGVRVRGHFAEMAQVVSQCNLRTPITSDDMDGDGYINHLDLIDSTSQFYMKRIYDVIQDYSANLKRDGATGEFIPDDDIDGDLVFNENDVDIDNDGMGTGYEQDHGMSEGGWQHPLVHNARYGIIIVGERFEGETHCRNDAIELHESLVNDMNWNSRNIYIFEDAMSFIQIDGITIQGDDSACARKISSVSKIININDFFLFFTHSHGSDRGGVFHWDEFAKFLNGQESAFISDNQESFQISKPLVANRSLFIISHCSSGFIGEGGPITELSSSNRIIITTDNYIYNRGFSFPTAPKKEHGAFIHGGNIDYGWDGDFTPGFAPNLKDDNIKQSIFFAYSNGYDACVNNRHFLASEGDDDYWVSYPLLEDNTSDGVYGHEYPDIEPNDPNSDGYLAYRTYI